MSSIASLKYLLPDGWAVPEVVEDRIVADALEIHRAGLSTVAPDGEEQCGSAAEAGGSALDRAWFELLERVSSYEASRRRLPAYAARGEDGADLSRTIPGDEVFPESTAPERWRFARSNGVALHASWAMACRRARWELAERDRVLRCWHGELAPSHLIHATPTNLGSVRSHEWQVYSFPETDPSSYSADIEVVGVFGFPRREGLPFVLGLAGRTSVDDAVAASAAEALQLLAFLWGEPLPEKVPSEPGPFQHLDTYQLEGAHHTVRRWLAGAHLPYGREPRRAAQEVGFVDLTPEWLPDGLRVAKAVCTEATPLVFGDSPLSSHLPRELRLHPIP